MIADPASYNKFSELCPELQALAERIDKDICPIRITTGHRGKAEQDLAYATKRSKVRWPNSKHNTVPSQAMDIVPMPVNYKSASLREELAFIAGGVRIIAKELGYNTRWGGDWDQDGDLEDNTFDDLFHFELRS